MKKILLLLSFLSFFSISYSQGIQRHLDRMDRIMNIWDQTEKLNRQAKDLRRTRITVYGTNVRKNWRDDVIRLGWVDTEIINCGKFIEIHKLNSQGGRYIYQRILKENDGQQPKFTVISQTPSGKQLILDILIIKGYGGYLEVFVKSGKTLEVYSM